MHYNIDFDVDFVTFRWDDKKTDAENYAIVDHPLKRKDCILMQYTGCRDPFGRKVWEGDILRFDIEKDPPHWPYAYSRFYRVIYYRGAFCSIPLEALTDFDKYDPCYLYEGVDDLVTGNALEHPELLQLTGEQPYQFTLTATISKP
ncbi:hypothetical protein IC229_27620 [Spirosoma sp. BT702]|uniref:YopX protein domain-containing protein n=1 Tax=Spirosoma profusum TaxID=2771354 RepID=A0A927ASU1_9BACT|nr:YopX family protein [Spirosoma profusum]MBD2704441.1 hypothetical protein [Spirosoma profusum]